VIGLRPGDSDGYLLLVVIGSTHLLLPVRLDEEKLAPRHYSLLNTTDTGLDGGSLHAPLPSFEIIRLMVCCKEDGCEMVQGLESAVSCGIHKFLLVAVRYCTKVI
jgi:hypothetical protein